MNGFHTHAPTRLTAPLAALALALLAPASALRAQAPAAQPGLWEITSQMEGLPRATGPTTRRVCLSGSDFVAEPERAFLAAARPPDGESGARRAAPKCELAALQRTPPQSSWTSTCEGPMGTVNGTGRGTLGPHSAELQQVMTMQMPFGKTTVTQRVSGRRVGDC